MNYEEVRNHYKDNDLSLKIVDCYIKVVDINNDINNMFFDFINKCLELEKLSDGKYQIQKSLKLNKIYFHGYLLDSGVCKDIKNSINSDYSIDQLDSYITKYESNSSFDMNFYHLAISLYKLADKIEEKIDDKIISEINTLLNFSKIIESVDSSNEDEYQNLYYKIRNDIESNYYNKNLIDKNIFDFSVELLNDIFNYYLSGYPIIPDSYLVKI